MAAASALIVAHRYAPPAFLPFSIRRRRRRRRRRLSNPKRTSATFLGNSLASQARSQSINIARAMSVVIHCAPINGMSEIALVNHNQRSQYEHEQEVENDNLNLKPMVGIENLKPPTNTIEQTTNHKQVESELALDQPNYYYHRPSMQDEQHATMLFTQHPQEHEQLQPQAQPHKQRTAMQLLPQQPTADNRHRLSTIHTNSHTAGHHLLQPTGQMHQKMRSYSHSNTFVPSPHSMACNGTNNNSLSTSLSSTGSSPSSSSGRHSAASSCHENAGENQHDSTDAAQLSVAVPRPRRLSRIEHRQSLLDLGYGKIESYFKLQRLGKGTYATVYMGRSRLSNDLVALKEILKEHDEGAPCTAIREVSLLRLLLHNNIVTLHDICHTPKKLTLVFEYVGPDLYAYMKENNNLLSIHNVRLLLYQLLRGISFCHSRQVLHRDLKPQNLLINSRGELKICDFGLARAKSIPTKSYSNEVVTLWYRPPDVLLGNTDYDHSIDMWGVGCIFYEMASGRTFFPGSNVRQQLYLIFSSLGAPNSHNWPEILQNPEYQSYSFPPFRPEKLAHRVPRLDSHGLLLLMSFLRFKPSERISADEARRHPFFASLPEQIHHLNERESIFDVPGIYVTLNPGQKLSGHHM